MITMLEIQKIAKESAMLDWDDPATIPESVIIEEIEGLKKYAVLWKATDGEQRIYGAVGGRLMVNPVMTMKKAEMIKNYLKQG